MTMKGRATKYLILEAILAVCLFGAAIGMRIYFMPVESYGLGVFYDAASVESQKAVPYIAGTGITQVYLYMLRGLFLIFGNIWQVGTIAQIVLFILGAMVFYFAVRKVIGSIGSLLIVAVMLCAPCFLPITYSYGPQMLYFLLFGMGLYYTHALVRDSEDRENFGALFILQTIFIGLYAGLLIYLDMFGVILVLPIVFLPYVVRNNVGAVKGLAMSLLWVLSAVLGLFVSALVEALCAGLSVGKLLMNWFDYSGRELFGLPVVSMKLSWEALLCDRHIWLGLFMAATYLVTLVYFLVYMIFKRTTRQVRELDVEALLINQLEEAPADVSQIEAPQAEEASVVQYIENPLPLPKKHVKKTLDYAFQPDFEDMDYDIRVSAKDDYDLK